MLSVTPEDEAFTTKDLIYYRFRLNVIEKRIVRRKEVFQMKHLAETLIDMGSPDQFHLKSRYK